MALKKLDIFDGVNENQSPEKLLEAVADGFNRLLALVIEVNNECVQLRNDLEEPKRRVR